MMKYRQLGKTGLAVSEIGFGGWAVAGNAHGDSYGPTDDAVSLSALNRAYELGCTLFDTADRFGRGHGETLLGRALQGWERDRVIVATKGGHDFGPDGGARPNFSEKALRRAVEASLERLGVEAIDLYQLHTPPLELIQHAGVFEVLKALKREGKIRFYGVSIQDPQEGIQAIRLGAVDAVMAIWNLFDRRIEKALVDECARTGTGLLIREPLARGFLGGTFTEGMVFEPGDHRAVWPRVFVNRRIQAANRFREALAKDGQTLAQLAIGAALRQEAVSSVVVGCKTPAQVEENMAAADGPPMSEGQFETLHGIYCSIFGSP